MKNKSFSYVIFFGLILIIVFFLLLIFNASFISRIYDHNFIKKKNLLPCSFINSSLETAEGINQVSLFSQKLKNFDIAFYGDSVLAKGMWNLLFPELNIVNYSGPGDTSFNVLSRLQKMTQIPKARFSFIMVGTNDLTYNCSVEEVSKNIVDIYLEIKKRSQGKVYVLSTLECNIFFDACIKRLSKIKALNLSLNKLSVAGKINLLDINKDLSDKSGLRFIYTYDGTHLNANGYSVLYKNLQREVF